jgi:GTP-binding protein
MTFVDELNIHMKAGDGGNGVVRWRQEKFRPKGGPAGGDGGRGGDVLVRAVRDTGILARYRHQHKFRSEDGEPGRANSEHGKNGADLVIDLPIGSIITNDDTGERFELLEENQTERILRGGAGGYGNEHFKGAENRRPMEWTEGKPGESANISIELELVVDAGLVGLPNAGKSSLLNTLTNATSKVGAYQFTTLEPHLGALFGYVLADIPGLIEGAAEGKGLGQKFLRHIKRTKAIIHCISVENEDVNQAYKTIRAELQAFDPELTNKEELIVITKTDLTDEDTVKEKMNALASYGKPMLAASILDDSSIKSLSDTLTQFLQ